MSDDEMKDIYQAAASWQHFRRQVSAALADAGRDHTDEATDAFMDEDVIEDLVNFIRTTHLAE